MIRLDISMPAGTYGKAVLPKGCRFENGDTSVDLNRGQLHTVINSFNDIT